MKTASDRIFELLHDRGMTQKDFSKRTGIAESTISDWKRKKNNPSSDKILKICEVLEVTPDELLSGIEAKGTRSRMPDYYVIDKSSELGVFVEKYQSFNLETQKRIIGYMEALSELNKE